MSGRQIEMTRADLKKLKLGPNSPLLPTARSIGGMEAHISRELNKDQEHADQVEIFRWAQEEGGEQHWELRTSLFYAIPNVGTFSRKIGARMTAEGRKKGVQDMSLDVARGPFHGCRIEQKVQGQKPSQEQVEHAQRLQDQGYFHRFSYSPEQTKQALLYYLSLGKGGPPWTW